ncbi:hypothetical protein RchiOBHm_Chr3g0469311 [Rosa chinensis]|uniref:Uncharacterized protein n=1 Tax=Rosa chinensis TaxID=74649 RepID=A0A2P6RAQ2_ROSCH|nr:hypothetical protein RchiOBHm_Chr3g0469311 [Rosa chinensis]
MKEKLCRCQATIKGISYKAFSCRHFCIPREVWKASIYETIRCTATTNRLLTNTGNHLANIDSRSLGATLGHDQGTVSPM